jgi:uncharacterized protein (DUF1810 family)
VRRVRDGVRIAAYMWPFLMLVDIFLFPKRRKEGIEKLSTMVCSCAHQLWTCSLQGCSSTIKSVFHAGNRLFVYGAVHFDFCTQLFLFNKICCLFDNRNWENFGNFCIV